MKKIVALFLSLVVFSLPFAAAQSGVNDDFLQSIGKIYVVVAVILTIFIGLVVYLIRLDKRIKDLEQ